MARPMSITGPEKTNAMKTHILRLIMPAAFMLLAVLATSGQAAASDHLAMATPGKPRTHNLERALERSLNKHIIFPVAAKGEGMYGEVHASFVVDREGRLEILECRSENADLADYVRTRLARVQVGENPDGIWKTTHVNFVFRPE